MSSPTSRTLEMYRKFGATIQVVEKFNQFSKTRLDLFGCIDLVAMHENSIIGIQATSGSNHSARRVKSLALPGLKLWLQCGGRFQIVSWTKKVTRNMDGTKSKVKRWYCRTEELFLKDIDFNSSGVIHPQ